MLLRRRILGSIGKWPGIEGRPSAQRGAMRSQPKAGTAGTSLRFSPGTHRAMRHCADVRSDEQRQQDARNSNR